MKQAAKPLVYIFMFFFLLPAYLFSIFLFLTLTSMESSGHFSSLASAFSDEEAISNIYSFLFILISAYMIFVEEKKNKWMKWLILTALVFMLFVTVLSYMLPAQYFGVQEAIETKNHTIIDIRKNFIDYTTNIVVIWFLAHGVDISSSIATKEKDQNET